MPFTINWLAALEHVARGFCWGAGFSLALVICLGVVPYFAKSLA
jgi:hypothetical protein